MQYESKFSVLDRNINKLSRRKIYLGTFCSLAVIGAADYWTSIDFPLSIFYLIPIGFITWSIGRRAGIVISLISIFPAVIGITHDIYFFRYRWPVIWSAILFLGFMLIFTYLLDALHKELREKQNALQSLESDRQHILFVSQHDSLTGLPNRGTFHTKLNEAIQESIVSNKPFHVLFIDIDRFKLINDSFGHYVGDLFLKGIAKSLQHCINPSTDIFARLSGDEFGIICNSELHGEKMALALLACSSAPISIEGQSINASISIGIASYPADATDCAKLLVCADLAMYHSKQNGRATFNAYTKEMETSAKRRQTINDGLRQALATNALDIYYQPIFNNHSGSVCAVEALLRWQNEDIPFLTPTEIVAVAEEVGMIGELGDWILKSACIQAKAWQDQNNLYVPVAVNISSLHFQDEGFVQFIKRTLSEINLDSAYLELEITERVVMDNTPHNKKTLEILKNIGVQISVDDFGTGFSSLSYLKNFKVDTLKIDQFFVKGLPYNEQDVAITNAIINLAHGLGVNVIAEGVENEQQLNFLKSAGCDQCQGYFLSEPISADLFAKKLMSQVWTRGLGNLQEKECV